MTGGDGTSGLGEWLDCECPECGTWFPVGARRCPGCGAESKWANEDGETIDDVLDELIGEMETDGPDWEAIEGPPASREDVPEEEVVEQPGKGGLLGRKLRSLFT